MKLERRQPETFVTGHLDALDETKSHRIATDYRNMCSTGA